MPTVRIDETLDLYYELDDFTDPWTTPDTILLVHGVADTSKAWFAWIPRLARQFRVLRPDMRGFGHSSIPPDDYAWSLSGFAQDLRILRRRQVVVVSIEGNVDFAVLEILANVVLKFFPQPLPKDSPSALHPDQGPTTRFTHNSCDVVPPRLVALLELGAR